MVKRMKLPFLSHSKSFDPKLLSTSSAFPSCGGHIKTLSFSFPAKDNPVLIETNASSSRTVSTVSEEDIGDPVEGFIRSGLRSDRFFFEPEQSSSLVNGKLSKDGSFGKQVETEENRVKTEENRGNRVIGYKESEMLWVDASDPFEYFKRPMVEMVKPEKIYSLVDERVRRDCAFGKHVETEENRVKSSVNEHKESEKLCMDSSDPFDSSCGIHVETEENRVNGHKESEMLDCSCGKQVETEENRVVEYKENEILCVDSPNPFEDSKPSMAEIVDRDHCSSLGDERLTKSKGGCPSRKQLETEENRAQNRVIGYKQSEMLWLDSSNPFEDFKQSMAEMVEAHNLMKDWDGLEELLSCYLEINGENNHGYILGAFIDLLASFAHPLHSTSTTRTTTTTTMSSVSSSSSIVYSSPSSPLSLHSSCLTTRSFSSALDHHVDYDHISS